MLRLQLSLVLVLCLLQVSGCYPSDPSGFGYVNKKGGPDEIARWAIRQKDATKISDALLALTSYTSTDSTMSIEQVDEAVDAVVIILSRYLRGWDLMVAPNHGFLIAPRKIPLECYYQLARASTRSTYAVAKFLCVE